MRVLAVVGAAIVESGKCLVAQRSSRMREPLKWEFPGGKVEPGESHRQALKREVAEELGLSIEVGEHLGRGLAGGSEPTLQLDVYRARLLGGNLDLAEHRAATWIDATEIRTLDWAEADRPILEALESCLRSD